MTQARREIKPSEVVRMCRASLCDISVTGPDNARRLAAIYDDLGIVQQILLQHEEGGGANGNPTASHAGDV